jgi:hypothetical protein
MIKLGRIFTALGVSDFEQQLNAYLNPRSIAPSAPLE